ncbi:MAG: hypothetical protein WDW38_005631 [Sanguina aurantia]
MSAPRYNKDLRADVQTSISASPAARVHRVEWKKVMEGSPVEINPSFGSGFKVMTVDEWAARWKNNEDFPACLNCNSKATKEHYFVQTWCRGRKRWESECLCLGCHKFSWRSYCDPDFQTPEEYEKQHWEGLTGKA